MKRYYLLLSLLLLLAHCQPDNTADPNTIFTIKGHVRNDSNYVMLVNYELNFSVDKNNADYQTLGFTTTDDKGFFSFSYKKCNVTGLGSEVKLNNLNQFNNLHNIGTPNTNISLTLIPSDIGILKVLLNTSQPLEKTQDTLFLGFYRPVTKTYLIDTITKSINGIHKAYMLEAFSGSGTVQDVKFGRGSKDFQYDPKTKTFSGTAHSITKNIKGNPGQGAVIVDTLTVNY